MQQADFDKLKQEHEYVLFLSFFKYKDKRSTSITSSLFGSTINISSVDPLLNLGCIHYKQANFIIYPAKAYTGFTVG